MVVGYGSCRAREGEETMNAKERKMREALELIAEQCEDHPLYYPDATEQDLKREGGDCASITYWAQVAREALKP